MYIPFHKPYVGKEEIDAVTRVIRSGLIGSGPFVKRFEHLFGTYVGSEHAIAVNSCTSALHLALLATEIGPGDEVITSAVTFSSTVNAIIYTGATPVLIDVNEDNLCMNVHLVEKEITSRTKAIIAVHYAGIACDLEELRGLCKKYGLVLIEDAAHAVATTYKGKRIGYDYSEIKELTCFSFQATKNISIGDGGMITTADADIAKRLRELRLFGMSEIDGANPALDATVRFSQEFIGYKYNMTDIEAAIGIEQLKKLSLMNQLRIEAAEYYSELLQELPYVEYPNVREKTEKTWYIYVIRIRVKYYTEGMVGRMILFLNKMGIQTSIHFLPIYQIPAFQTYFMGVSERMTIAEANTKRIISLPFYPNIKKEEIQYIVKGIRAFFESEL